MPSSTVAGYNVITPCTKSDKCYEEGFSANHLCLTVTFGKMVLLCMSKKQYSSMILQVQLLLESRNYMIGSLFKELILRIFG